VCVCVLGGSVGTRQGMGSVIRGDSLSLRHNRTALKNHTFDFHDWIRDWRLLSSG
jgi:hypothetical protein